jgi:DNA invertase Pin-like site-specific DNA recombinase
MASSSKSTKTIKVSEDDIDAVQEFLASLAIQKKGKGAASSTTQRPEEPTSEMLVVTKVLGARNTSPSDWEFNCRFKGISKPQWVKDENCECEKLISAVLPVEVKTAYCFCRVSSKQQTGDTHVSLEAQEEALVEKALGAGFQRIKTYKISASAYKNLPTSLVGIGEGCKSGDAIFIYRVDRLTRNIIKSLAWMEEMDKAGVTISSIDPGLLYHENKLQFIQAVVDAQKESVLIGSRVRMSIDRRKARGDECVGGLPYGKKYERNEDGSLKVVNNLSEMAIITRILRQRGRTDKFIADGLSSSGIMKKNRKWTPSMVSAICKRYG